MHFSAAYFAGSHCTTQKRNKYRLSRQR